MLRELGATTIYYKENDTFTYLLISNGLNQWLSKGIMPLNGVKELIKELECLYYQQHHCISFDDYITVLHRCGFFIEPKKFDIRLLITRTFTEKQDLYLFLKRNQIVFSQMEAKEYAIA